VFTQTAPVVLGGGGNTQNSNAGNNTIQGGDQSVDHGSGDVRHARKDDCPPKGEPKDDCPPKGEPKDDCPPKGKPKDDCPPKGEPKDDCPPKGKPKDDCPPKGEPKDDCPPKGKPKDKCPPKGRPKNDCRPKHDSPKAKHNQGQGAHQGQVNHNDADQYNVGSVFTQTAPVVTGGSGNTQNSNAGNNTIQGGDQTVGRRAESNSKPERGGVALPV
jgi:hypothetical protein